MTAVGMPTEVIEVPTYSLPTTGRAGAKKRWRRSLAQNECTSPVRTIGLRTACSPNTSMRRSRSAS